MTDKIIIILEINIHSFDCTEMAERAGSLHNDNHTPDERKINVAAAELPSKGTRSEFAMKYIWPV